MKKNIPEKNNPDESATRFDKLTLLSASSTTFADSPAQAKLEIFDNIYKKRDYTITFECPEFTSLCPVTNQPDFGEITINYVPDKYCIESKSLKLYLFSYRNHNAFHEETVNSILDDIVNACSPRWVEVIGNFRPRGGIAIKVAATKGNRKIKK